MGGRSDRGNALVETRWALGAVPGFALETLDGLPRMESFGALLAVATLGTLRIQPLREPPSGPTLDPIRRAAPRAWRLADSLRSHCDPPVPEGVAARCTYTFVIDDRRPDPVGFTMRVTMESLPDRRECVRHQTVHVPLSDRRALASTLASRFSSFRPLCSVSEPP